MKIQHFMALVVLSLATVPGARAAVLAGSLTNPANAHTYYLLSTNTWAASEAEAIGLGGHLVTINDAAENQWVQNTFFPWTGDAGLWIGLNDAANEGQFVWASGEPVTFTYWYPGEPNNLTGEDYAAIRRMNEVPPTGSWNDTSGLVHPTAPMFGVVELPSTPTPLPAAATQLPDQFMPGSAQLNGLANPSGSPTLAWFEWGTSLAYGNATPPQSVGSGSNLVGFSNVLAGLVIGTEYHFRALASNAFGFATGVDQTFNLGNQRPVVTTLAADQLTTNSAWLRGQVNPRGWPTAAWFEWGTDTNYGNLIGMLDVGQGSSVSNLNVVLNGLTNGIYHYRLVATNAFGAGYGADQAFNLRPTTTNTWTGADPSGYWSAPANWSPAGVPVNGNDLVFPGGLPPGDMVSTNDLTDSVFRSITFNLGSRHTIRGNLMTLTNRANVIINNGTNVIACDLIFSGTPPTPTFGVVSIRGRVASSGVVSELTVIGNVGGGSLYATLERLVINGQFTGGTLRLWGGALTFYGDDPSAGSAEVQNSATLLVQGSRPNLNITMFWEFESAACPFLRGGGVVGDVLGCGRIILDSTLSVKSLGGPGASTYGSRTLDIHLNGTNVGEYGRLISSGEVTLIGGSLSASPGFNPQPGQVFTIVNKTSPGPITTVPGYDPTLFGPEGKIITLNGMPFRLSYVGGDGNDVTLTALGFVPIPIPGLPAVSGSSVAWGDYDNDGRLDFLLTGNGTGAGSQLWRNTGSGFSNVTASVVPGLPAVYVGSVAWGDYDNDGRLDFLLTGSGISQLWRNTGSGFSNVTASVAPGLPGVSGSSVAWGDYDNDGRLDFLLTGFASGSGNPYVSQLWRNTGSGFSNVTASVAPGLPGTANGGAWGDYDNDGRLDLLLNGSGIFQLWRNTGAGFSNVTASVAPGLPRLYGTSVAWGDFDNDGRLDFLLAGTTDGEFPPVGGNERSQLWRNTGTGFGDVTASVTPGLPGVSSGSMAWGDYDNDGRLDFLLTGAGKSQLWRNNMPVASNAPPAAPTGLSSTLSGATVSLNWNPPADDRTPSPGLNYNVRIGNTPGASDVLAPMALTDGLRLLPALGNAQAGTNAVMNLPFGRYYWSVQAVDTSFAGSPFAVEQQFTIAPRIFEPLLLGNGHFQFSFSNQSSAVYEVLGTTNLALPVAQWSVLGPPVSLGGGLYRFTDTGAMGQAQRFYILRAQ